MSGPLWFALACGVLALIYAIWAARVTISADAGNERMQEISGAVQEGAQAFLNRQYSTIGVVGVGRRGCRLRRVVGGYLEGRRADQRPGVHLDRNGQAVDGFVLAGFVVVENQRQGGQFRDRLVMWPDHLRELDGVVGHITAADRGGDLEVA